MPNLRTLFLGRWLAATLGGGLLAALGGAAPTIDGPYSIVDRWTVRGTGRWDYLTLDSPRQRLFITRGEWVQVLDTASGRVIGQIQNTPGVHGVALAPDLKRGYTSNGRSNTLTEFDYDTLAVLREVPVPGVNPDAILYQTASQRLFLFNGGSRDATVYDARSLTVIAKIPLPGKPEFAIDDGRGRVYVNIETTPGKLVAIDSGTYTLSATWTLPGCASPTGLAIDTERERMFSVCDGKIMAVTDAKTGRQIARVAIGDGSDAVAYDATHGLVFSSNDEGSITVVRAILADKYVVAGTLTTQRGSKTMAFDPTSRRIYIVAAQFEPTPPTTPDYPHPRPEPRPDTVTVLVAEPR